MDVQLALADGVYGGQTQPPLVQKAANMDEALPRSLLRSLISDLSSLIPPCPYLPQIR